MRNAAYRGMASYANWRSQAAQQILIQRATDKSLDVDARIDAADALAQAVKLQASGVQQDPPMFQALVGLLSDENEPLRAVAFLALAPIREYIVGGSNGGAVSSRRRLAEMVGQDHSPTGRRPDLLPCLRTGRQRPHRH